MFFLTGCGGGVEVNANYITEENKVEDYTFMPDCHIKVTAKNNSDFYVEKLVLSSEYQRSSGLKGSETWYFRRLNAKGGESTKL